MPAVLIVDDLLSIHEMLDAVIQPTGFATAFATDGEKALVRYKSESFDLVLADIDMKPMDGITLLKELKHYDPSCVVVIMTAYASTDSAIQALKYGAFDYLQKPFRVDELIATLKRGVEFRKLQAEQSRNVSSAIDSGNIESQIVGSNRKMQKLRQQITKLVGVRTPALLEGERGTDKATVAAILHQGSAQEGGELVGIDCSLSSEDNFRAGLLGENGQGGDWVLRAKGGTLYLQHLQCLPLDMQGELVSVLRNNAHNFRLVCTTSEDLEVFTDEGKFNDELFYRVAALPVKIPPLRDHLDDLPELIRSFLGETTNPFFDTKQIEFTPDAMAVLMDYHWPGNIMELRQLVVKLASTSEARIITSSQLPMRLKEVKKWPSLAEYLDGQRRRYVEMVLHATNGDRRIAQSVLGTEPDQFL